MQNESDLNSRLKVTPSWLLRFFPFLAKLLTDSGTTGRQKVSIRIHRDTGTKIEVKPAISGSTRFISATEQYYAVLDIHVKYGTRQLNLYLKPETIENFSKELKNQLAPTGIFSKLT